MILTAIGILGYGILAFLAFAFLSWLNSLRDWDKGDNDDED